MAIIKVKSIDELELPNIPVDFGSTSHIYEYNGKYFKLFDPDYMTLDDKNVRRKLQVLSELMDTKVFKYFILPDDLYVADGSFLGYTMPIGTGRKFDGLLDIVSYDLVINAFKEILEDIKKLSDLGIINSDIWSNNVLFDNHNLYLIDFDDCHYQTDKVLNYHIMGAFMLNVILENMLIDFDLNWLNDMDINNVRRGIYNLERDDYIAFLNLLKLKLERIKKDQIVSVGDVRRTLCKVCNYRC